MSWTATISAVLADVYHVSRVGFGVAIVGAVTLWLATGIPFLRILESARPREHAREPEIAP
jgi:hypothetical protein